MSDALQRAMSAVRADADAVVLAAPGAVRRAGTRRTRMKVLSAAFAALVVITGASIGANQYFQRAAPVVGETPTPPVPSTPAPSVTPNPTPSVEVPAAPPLDPCSTDVKKCYPPGVISQREKLPAPCTTTQHPSESLRLARQSFELHGLIDGVTGQFYPDFNSSVTNPASMMYGQTFTRYSGAGAGQYLSELRVAVGRCPSVVRPIENSNERRTWRYKLVSTNQLGGDESLLLSRTYYQPQTEGSGPSSDITYLIAVVRIGNTIVVIYDYGWEFSSSRRITIDAIIAHAIGVARAWRP